MINRHPLQGAVADQQVEARRLLRAQLDKEDQALCLKSLEQHYNPSDGTCIYFRTIAAETGLTFDEVRRHVRAAAGDGLAKYHKGLWTEDGEPAGAGYCITEKGLEYLEQLRANICDQIVPSDIRVMLADMEFARKEAAGAKNLLMSCLEFKSLPATAHDRIAMATVKLDRVLDAAKKRPADGGDQ